MINTRSSMTYDEAIARCRDAFVEPYKGEIDFEIPSENDGMEFDLVGNPTSDLDTLKDFHGLNLHLVAYAMADSERSLDTCLQAGPNIPDVVAMITVRVLGSHPFSFRAIGFRDKGFAELLLSEGHMMGGADTC